MRALAASESSDKPLTTLLPDDLPAAARPFAVELAQGTTRQRLRLDHTLQPLLKQPLAKLDPPVRAVLRLALYERALLQSPAHVVGQEYTGLLRGEKLTSATALVNAIARRLPDQLIEPPPASEGEAEHLAVLYSHPLWLVERWLARLGFEATAALCAANNVTAPLNLRVNSLRTNRDEVLKGLRGSGLEVQQGALSPFAIQVEHAGSPLEWGAWKVGHIIAQDEGAQLVSLMAAPAPGNTIVDAASAPGGKTTHMAALLENQGTVLACDSAPGRLKLVMDNAQRLGVTCIETRAGDWRELAPQLPPADIVLLDAPCLGTGTLRRRPDAKWRKTPKVLAELIALQRALLDSSTQVVRPGGVLVYSTCSLEPEENIEQVQAFLSRHPEWRLESPPEAWAANLQAVTNADGTVQTWPHRHGCDGMFAARLRFGA